jgi:hypothetical protein
MPAIDILMLCQPVTTSILTIMFYQRLSVLSLILLVSLVNTAPVPGRDPATPSQELNQALKTGPGQAIFWSGKTMVEGKKRSARLDAWKQAESTGGKTLDMAMKEGGIPIPSKPPPGPKQKIQDQRQWKKPSIIFAKKAQGEIDVHLGEAVKPDSVYNQYEKPKLLANPKVTKVTHRRPDGSTEVIKGQP